MRDELIIEKIKSAISAIDDIDEMINTQSENLQKVDYEISDWLHYIENNDIDEKIAVRLIERLKTLRQIRRSLHNEYEIESVYKNNSSKMMGNNTRTILLAEINKKIKELNNDYKNRIITDDDIRQLTESTKKKVGRPRKEKTDG